MAHSRSTILTAFGLLLVGCSYSDFTDLQDRAPAARVDQDDSEITSTSFGDQLVGLTRPGELEGGLLAITGNSDPSFASSTITASGSVKTAHADSEDVRDELGDPARLTAMAAAPSATPVGSAQGPFVYVGGTNAGKGSVRVIDVNTFRHLREYQAPPKPVPVAEFGLGLVGARLGGDIAVDDLAVGAKDAVVLLRAADGGVLSWPDMQESGAVVVSGGSGWPSGGFSVMASGDLDPSTAEDEVVAANPEKNAVVVIHHVDDCFQDNTVVCSNYLQLPVPAGASRFGAALLVADVDGDGAAELLVGAPDVNRVYIYDLAAEHLALQNPTPPPTPATLTATGTRDFGSALAFGEVDNSGAPLLVVGAPGTDVSGSASAGRLYLYGSDLKPIGEGVELATPEERAQLGRRLTVMPLRQAGQNEPVQLLAASGRKAVFIFFANLTANHQDVRQK